MKRALGMLAIVCPLGATCLDEPNTVTAVPLPGLGDGVSAVLHQYEKNTVTVPLPGTVTINSGTLTNSAAPTCPEGYVLVAEGGVMSHSWIKCAPRSALVEPKW